MKYNIQTEIENGKIYKLQGKVKAARFLAYMKRSFPDRKLTCKNIHWYLDLFQKEVTGYYKKAARIWTENCKFKM